jgi:dienelactone hydrolase
LASSHRSVLPDAASASIPPKRCEASRAPQDRGPKFVERQQAEAGDINAALEYVMSLPGSSIDPKRVAIMGWSFGGIVTTLAASRSEHYAAVVVQAPGALNWNRSDVFRKALTDAAAKIRVPTHIRSAIQTRALERSPAAR